MGNKLLVTTTYSMILFANANSESVEAALSSNSLSHKSSAASGSMHYLSSNNPNSTGAKKQVNEAGQGQTLGDTETLGPAGPWTTGPANSSSDAVNTSSSRLRQKIKHNQTSNSSASSPEFLRHGTDEVIMQPEASSAKYVSATTTSTSVYQDPESLRDHGLSYVSDAVLQSQSLSLGMNGSAMQTSPARRLAQLTFATPSGVGSRWITNVLMVRMSRTQLAIVFQDYGFSRKGMRVLCTENSAPSLSCDGAGAFTTGPVHHEQRSLAAAPIGTKLLFAWRQGDSPYSGQIKLCSAASLSCGSPLSVRRAWSGVSAAVLSTSLAVVAYSDRQRNHRGVVMPCSIAELAVSCPDEIIFEVQPTHWLSVASLANDGDGAVIATNKFIIGYEVGTGLERKGRLIPCQTTTDSIACEPLSVVDFTASSAEGVSLQTISASLFIVAHADEGRYCPALNRQARRRVQHTCTVTEGHPTIAKIQVCSAQYVGLGITRPVILCGTSTVLDDGYDTKFPVLARHSDTAFVAAYACEGCADLGAKGFVRYCSFSGLPPTSTVNCGAATQVNNFRTRSMALTAIQYGVAAVFEDYGGGQYGRVTHASWP